MVEVLVYHVFYRDPRVDEHYEYEVAKNPEDLVDVLSSIVAAKGCFVEIVVVRSYVDEKLLYKLQETKEKEGE